MTALLFTLVLGVGLTALCVREYRRMKRQIARDEAFDAWAWDVKEEPASGGRSRVR